MAKRWLSYKSVSTGHLQIGQAAALAMQLLDLVGVANVAFVQRRLLSVIGGLQVLQIALVPKLYIAVRLSVLDWSEAERERERECNREREREGVGYIAKKRK